MNKAGTNTLQLNDRNRHTNNEIHYLVCDTDDKEDIYHFMLHCISSVYRPFSDRVGLPHHNTPLPRVLMKNTGAAFLQPDALPDVNHMRGMQYQIVLNIILMPEITNTVVHICVYNSYTKQQH